MGIRWGYGIPAVPSNLVSSGMMEGKGAYHTPSATCWNMSSSPLSIVLGRSFRTSTRRSGSASGPCLSGRSSKLIYVLQFLRLPTNLLSSFHSPVTSLSLSASPWLQVTSLGCRVADTYFPGNVIGRPSCRSTEMPRFAPRRLRFHQSSSRLLSFSYN